VDFELSDEQRLLADTLTGLLEKRYDANTRLKLIDSEQGWSRELWQQYAELGLLGLGFDEQHGGAGMGPAELAVVMEGFGRALVLEPFFSTVVLAGSLIAAAATPEQQAELLPRIAAGQLLVAFGYAEPRSRWSLTELKTTATRDGDAWTVTGEKIAVVGGDSAEQLIVSARTPDDTIGLFLVAATDVTRAPYPMQDGQRGADVLLQAAPAQLLGSSTDALSVIESVIDTATAALCAEAVGAMERMLAMTVDYLKTRVQFGQPISVFQALQFRAADMYVSLEQARSMALLARLALSGDDPVERRRAVRAAKVQIDLASRHVGQEAIQLHGGIGMTMEYPVGHYVKRTTVIAKTFADTTELLDLVGADGGLIRPPS
jgi:alkylation response protein AidB-like acyl-CoA dehydrogenase